MHRIVLDKCVLQLLIDVDKSENVDVTMSCSDIPRAKQTIQHKCTC